MPDGFPTPVLEQIRQDLLKTLATITPAAGYTFTATPTEPDRLGETVGDGVVELTLGAADWNRDVEACGLAEWMQEFVFTGYSMQSETLYVPWDGLNLNRYADIYKAIQKDPTRGNWAHDTLPEAPEWFRRTQGQNEGVCVRCWVRYRHDFGNPYSVR